MAGNKTVENDHSVMNFIESVENEQRKRDAFQSLELHKRLTGLEPKMWGPSIIGFGNYHYKYESGREGDFFKAGFSPRKNSMTFYIMSNFPEYQDLLTKLGKHKTGKSCLYISQLDKINIEILEEIVTKSFEAMNVKYPEDE